MANAERNLNHGGIANRGMPTPADLEYFLECRDCASEDKERYAMEVQKYLDGRLKWHPRCLNGWRACVYHEAYDGVIIDRILKDMWEEMSKQQNSF